MSNVSVDGGAESAYVQLNKGNTITKLGADDLSSMNAIVDALPMSLGGSWTTWSAHENFFSSTGGINEPDKETLNKLRSGDTIEANDMLQTIFMFYGRNTKLSGGSTGFQEALVQFGLDSESVLDLNKTILNKNDTVYFQDYTFEKNSIIPIDTMYKTAPKKGETFTQAASRLRRTIDSVKSSK
ncbi:hypothetical protein [Chryseobacterium kwangjuense]|uniref:Uncharacterized protein n=1 Tax=Chryseobacterium kwangjuense TaxID=267125 RepID=A0A135WFN3_9FLAO|nr:hypothetical protein [Chryseobacterium kwangjuense]KXH83719.1 hypothetical protein AU378_22715 [Chryseobacterium kwangjuense]